MNFNRIFVEIHCCCIRSSAQTVWLHMTRKLHLLYDVNY